MLIYDKRIRILIEIIALCIFTALLTLSYAYFTANVKSNEKENVVTTGTMSLEFEDTAEVSLENATPGSSITKTFKVKNTGNITTLYNVYLTHVINTLEDASDLVYTITSSNGCQKSSESIMPTTSGEESKIVSSCSIDPNQTHEYEMTITFKETNDNQNDNVNKTFSGVLAINKYGIYEGTSGQVSWDYDDVTRTLKISGSGNMEHYSLDNLPEWYYYKNEIKNIEIGEDVTKIGAYSFYKLTNVENLRIDSIFLNDLPNYTADANASKNYALYQLGNDTENGATITFGKKVTIIPKYLMEPSVQDRTSSKVTNFIFEGNNITTINNYGLAFYKGAILVLPQGVTRSLGMAFAFGEMYLAVFPDSLKNIDHYSLHNSSALEKVVYGPKLTRVYEAFFSQSPNLKTVIIPHIDNPAATPAFTNYGRNIDVYGDSSTQIWVNNMNTTYNLKLVYHPLTDYSSSITSNTTINANVAYNESFTFESDKNVKIYYIYTSIKNGNTYKKEMKEYIKDGNTYTINGVKSDLYIEVSN